MLMGGARMGDELSRLVCGRRLCVDERSREALVSEARFVSVEEAGRRIGIGRTLAYALCRAHLDGASDGLPCVRLGRRVLVPVWAIDELGRPSGDAARLPD